MVYSPKYIDHIDISDLITYKTQGGGETIYLSQNVQEYHDSFIFSNDKQYLNYLNYLWKKRRRAYTLGIMRQQPKSKINTKHEIFTTILDLNQLRILLKWHFVIIFFETIIIMSFEKVDKTSERDVKWYEIADLIKPLNNQDTWRVCYMYVTIRFNCYMMFLRLQSWLFL